MENNTTDPTVPDLLPWGNSPEEQTRNYVVTLAGGPDRPLLWVTIRPDSHVTERWGSLDESLAWLKAENDEHRAGIFVGIQVSDGTGRKAENITAGRVVAGDADGVRIAEWHKPPTMVVQSKAGPHPYLMLTQHGAVEATAKACRGLAYHYGLDPAATDPQRVLRVPGFKHWKDLNNPFLVTLLAPGAARGPLYAAPSDADPAPMMTADQWRTYEVWTSVKRLIASDPKLAGSERLSSYKSMSKKVRQRAEAWSEYCGMVRTLRRRLEARQVGLEIAGAVVARESGGDVDAADLSARLRIDGWLRDHRIEPWRGAHEGDYWRSRSDHAEFAAMAAILPPVSPIVVQDLGTPEWEAQRIRARVWVARVRTWEARSRQQLLASRNPGASVLPGPHPGGFDPGKITQADIAESEDSGVTVGGGDLTTLRVVELCADHGWLRGDGGSGWSEIVCPWAHRHSHGSGETAGVRRGIDSGGQPGAGKPAGFHCFHASCTTAGLKDFIKFVGRDIVASYCTRKLGVEQVEGARSRLTVADAISSAPEETRKFVIPSGWLLRNDGVFRLGEAGPVGIASLPIILTGGAVVVGLGDRQSVVAWGRDGVWTKRVVSRRTIADTRKVLELADAGAPVTSGNAGRVVEWLADFEAANATALAQHVERVSRRMGWLSPADLGAKTGGFLLGADWFGFDGTSDVRFGDDAADLSAGFTKTGTIDGWRAAATRAQGFPLAATAIYSSLAAPLLRLLNLPGFGIEWAGVTTGGKTTALQIAASVWGRPDREGIVHSWDTTGVGRERLASAQCDLPLILDDTQQAKRGEDVTNAIYQLAGGKGRVRGAVEGMRRTEIWRTIVHSSGERTAASYDPGAGGAVARVLSIWGRPFGDDPALGLSASTDISAAIRTHHGTAGRSWIEWLLSEVKADKSNLRRWKADYEAHLAACVARAGEKSAVASRLASAMALLVLAEALARKALQLPAFDLLLVWDQIVTGLPDTDRPKVAFVAAVEWASTHPDSWYVLGNEAARPGAPGLAGRWDGPGQTIFWVRTHLLQVIEALGYPGESTIRIWIDRGWLDAGSDGRGVRTRLGGRQQPQTRALAMLPNIVAKLAGLEVEDDAKGLKVVWLDKFREQRLADAVPVHALTTAATPTVPSDEDVPLRDEMRSPAWAGGDDDL